MTCYRSYRRFAATQENSVEHLSVSGSISKHWTILKTEVVGGPSNSTELKQIQWRQKRLNNNRLKLAKQQLNLHVHHTFLSMAVVAQLQLEISHVL